MVAYGLWCCSLCPLCRVETFFVVPSPKQLSNSAEKDAVVSAYKAMLRGKQCKVRGGQRSPVIERPTPRPRSMLQTCQCCFVLYFIYPFSCSCVCVHEQYDQEGGNCPFGSSCFYWHAGDEGIGDGRRARQSSRVIVNALGESEALGVAGGTRLLSGVLISELIDQKLSLS